MYRVSFDGSSGVPSAGWQKTMRLRRAVQARRELLLQRRERDVAEVDHPPPRLALRRRDLVADERLPDVKAAVEELHVLPAKPEKLAPPQTRREAIVVMRRAAAYQ